MIAFVARHGETTWNAEGRYQGKLESPLSALGVRQADALAAACENVTPQIARIVSSPLGRCTQTANAVAQRLGLTVECDARLLEISHGDWEGRLRDEIERDDPVRYAAWRASPALVTFPNGESLLDVANRWQSFASEPLLAPTLIVTHDAVVRVAILLAEGRPLDDLWDIAMENAAYATFDASPTGWRVVTPLENAHLRALHANVAAQAL